MASLASAWGLIKGAFSAGSQVWTTWRRSLEVDRGLRDQQFEKARKQEALEAAVVYREPFFYKGEDDDPICPGCWQQPVRNLVYLQPVSKLHEHGTPFRDCPVCKQTYYVKNRG